MRGNLLALPTGVPSWVAWSALTASVWRQVGLWEALVGLVCLIVATTCVVPLLLVAACNAEEPTPKMPSDDGLTHHIATHLDADGGSPPPSCGRSATT
jgi:hypothetical protein